jgi:hypothetical protein
MAIAREKRDDVGAGFNAGLRDTSAQTLDLLNGRRGTHIPLVVALKITAVPCQGIWKRRSSTDADGRQSMKHKWVR